MFGGYINNHGGIYKDLIFCRRNRRWNDRLIDSHFLTRFLPTALLCGYFFAYPTVLFALPAGERVSHGSATFERSGGNLIIRQGTDKLITQWTDFSIAAGERTEFQQPNANSSALNRVVGGSRSIIDGELRANGKVVLINPAGVTVGPTGVVNVNSFTASTHDLTDQEFIGGGELLYKGTSQETVENHGIIRASGGDAILIAKHVKNTGLIEATNGTAALVGGTEVLVKPSGEERIFIKPISEKGATVTQGTTGRIAAASAEIKAVGNPYAVAINLEGFVQAPKTKVAGGEGETRVAGTIKAQKTDGTGGDIVVTSKQVRVAAGAVVDASGSAGGSVKIGGGFQGKDATVENASQTLIESGAQILADATGANSPGGTVIVWANETTQFYGNISARGVGSGAGGFAEVSGKGLLDFQGFVNLSSDTGLAGTLLLDPTNITINAAGPNANINTTTYVSNGATVATANSVLMVSTLVASLNAGTNVNVQTAATPNAATGLGGSGTSGAVNDGVAGDILVSDAITWTHASSMLTLTAHDDVIINGAITNANAASTGEFRIAATGGYFINELISVNGGVRLAGTQNSFIHQNITTGAAGALTLLAGTASPVGLPVTAATGAGALSIDSGLILTSGTGGLSLGSGGNANVIQTTGRTNLSGVILKYADAGNAFGAVDINGFVGINLDFQNNAGTVVSLLNSTGSVSIKGAGNVQIDHSITTGSAGSLTLIGGGVATSGPVDVSAPSAGSSGSLVLSPGIILAAGTGALSLGSGGTAVPSSPTGRTNIAGVILKYADASNTFGAVNINGFNAINLDFQNNAGIGVNFLNSTGSVTIKGTGAVQIDHSITTGSASGLTLIGGGVSTVAPLGAASPAAGSFGSLILSSGIILTVGTGSLSLGSGGNSSAYLSTSRSSIAGVTFKYADASNAFGDVDLNGFAAINLDFQNNAGVVVNVLASTGSVSIKGTGDVQIDHDIITGSTSDLSLLGGGVSTATVTGVPVAVPSSFGRLILSSGVTLAVGSGNLSMGSSGNGTPGLPTNRADLAGVTLKYVSGTNSFGNVDINGFDDISFAMRDSADAVTTALQAAGSIFIKGTGQVVLTNSVIATGAAGSLTLIGAGVGQSTPTISAANLTGQLVLNSGVILRPGTGGLSLGSGSFGGTRPVLNADIRYASNTNVVGAVDINGFNGSNLNLVNFDGTASSLLLSNSSVSVKVFGELTLDYDITTGANSSLTFAGGAVSTTTVINAGEDPTGRIVLVGDRVLTAYTNLSVGSGTVAGIRTNGTDATNSLTLQYLNPANEFADVSIQGFQNYDLKVNNSNGTTASTLRASGAVDIRAVGGVVNISQDLYAGTNLTVTANDVGSLTVTNAANSTTDGQLIFNGTNQVLSAGADVNLFSGTEAGASTTRVDFGDVAFAYSGATTAYSNFRVLGFHDAIIKMATAPSLNVTTTNVNNGFLTYNYTGNLQFQTDVNASTVNAVQIAADRVNNGNFIFHNLSPSQQIDVTLGTNGDNSTAGSSFIMDTELLTMHGTIRGDVTIRERDNLQFTATPSGGTGLFYTAGSSFSLLGQGDLQLNGSTLGNSSIDVDLTVTADADLNSIYGTTIGADGFGAVTTGKSAIIPVFAAPIYYSGPGFTYSVNAAGTVITIVGDPAFATMSLNTMQRVLQSFGLSVAANAAGSLAANQLGYAIPTSVVTIPVSAQPSVNYFESGGQVAYVIRSYTTKTNNAPVAFTWTSLGLGVTSLASNAFSLTAASQLAGADTLGTIVDGTTNPFGNPQLGGTSLNMSGQFYTYAVGSTAIPGVTVASASGTPSTFGWLTQTTAVQTFSTSGGNITIVSAPRRAIDGGWNDVDFSASVPASLTLGNPVPLREYFRATIGTNGSFVMSGPRDVYLRSGGITGTNSFAGIQAGRDIIATVTGIITGNNQLSLIAGGAIVTAPTVTLGSGTTNLHALAAQGVNLSTNLVSLEGGLGFWNASTNYIGNGYSSANYAAMLASADRQVDAAAAALAGNFVITETDGSGNGLTIGSSNTNLRVYNSGTQLSESNQAATGLSSAAATATTLPGNLILTTPNGLAIAEAITVATTGLTGGEVNLRASSGEVSVGANILATNHRVLIQAAQAITWSAGLITADTLGLTAGTTIGTSGNRLQTALNTLGFTAAWDVFINEASALTAAGTTTALNGAIHLTTGGTLTVGTVAVTSLLGNAATVSSKYGLNANGSGAINLTASDPTSDIVFSATARSGTGTITAIAGQNLLDGIAGELIAGASTADLALNLATGGGVVLQSQLESIGGDGVSINALEVWSSSISTTSGGSTGARGTYLVLLDTGSTPSVAGLAITILSGRNIDVTSRTSDLALTGNLTTGGAVISQNSGYIRLAADRNVTIENAVTASGSGNVILTAGLAGTGNVTLNGVTSALGGEINIRAADGVVLNSSLLGGPRVIVEAVNGAISRTLGSILTGIPSGSISLRAGTTIGSASQRILLNAATMVASSGGDTFITGTNGGTISLRSLTNGRLDYETAVGSILVDAATISTGITSTTGGVTPLAAGLDSTTWNHGIRANGTGAVRVVANGSPLDTDLILNRSLTSGSGNITVSAARNVQFNTVSQIVTGGDAWVTATGGSVMDSSGSATAIQIVADEATFTASIYIGSGLMGSVTNLGTTVRVLSASGGDANLYETDAVTLADVMIFPGNFRLNTGGLIDQITGATVQVALTTELDTTRDATRGHATVNDTGALTLGDSEVAGNYQIETTGLTSLAGTLLVAGDLTIGNGGLLLLSGTSVVGGDFTLSGTYNRTGGALTVYGFSNALGAGLTLPNALATLTGTTLTVNAIGTNPDFDLAAAISTAVSLLTGATDVVVNLQNTIISIPNSILNQDAVRLTNAGNQIDSLVVRTGPVPLTPTTSSPFDYNLVQSAAVDLGTRSLTINAAIGTDFGGTSALNGNKGSFVELANGNNRFGIVRANETWNTRIRERTALDVGTSLVHGNLDAQSLGGNVNVGIGGAPVEVDGTARLVAVGANADVNFLGATTLHGNAIAAAGEDIRIAAGVTITGDGAMTFVVDENAGTARGDGWFDNQGMIITNDPDQRIALYAVSGPSHLSGYNSGGGNQINFGNLLDGTGTYANAVTTMMSWKGLGGSTLNGKYATSYQAGGTYHPGGWGDYDPGQGLFGSPVVWYKDLVSLVPAPTLVGSVSLPAITPTGASLAGIATIFYHLAEETLNTTQPDYFTPFDPYLGSYQESFYRQKNFGVFFQRAAFKEALNLWLPEPEELTGSRFEDERLFLQSKSLVREKGTRRAQSEYVE